MPQYSLTIDGTDAGILRGATLKSTPRKRRKQARWVRAVGKVLLAPFILAGKINDWVYGWKRRY